MSFQGRGRGRGMFRERLAAKKAAALRAQADQLAADKAAALKAQADQLAADKAAALKAQADQLAAEKAAIEKAAALKAQADQLAFEKAKAEKAVALKAQADQLAFEKAAALKAQAEKLEAEKAAALKIATEKEFESFYLKFLNGKYGPYIVKETLGKNGPAVVYLCEHEVSKSRRVFKLVNFNPKNMKEIESINTEIRIGIGCCKKCAFLVNYEDVSMRMGIGECLITMEYCGGGDLRGAIDRHIAEQTAFTEEELLRFLFEVGTAVRTLHIDNVVHRDIKAENVFLVERGGYKLGDFGIARVLTTGGTITRAGTDGYIPPEILSGDCDYSTSVDIYSLGCLLLEMIALRHPFKNEKGALNYIAVSMGKLNPVDSSRCSAPLLELAIRMVSLDVSKRPPVEEILSSPVLAATAAKY